LSLISEDETLLAYEFTFLICAVIAFVFFESKKETVSPVERKGQGYGCCF